MTDVPDTQDEASIAQAFDGRIDLDDQRLRVRGLPDHPDGWHRLVDA
ncbi:hypothetical protein VB779_17275 [Haloarculaceae archaeon H-GB11]|nr:hypothetical protein [Haloarculaceae archaeon H-GB11]